MNEILMSRAAENPSAIASNVLLAEAELLDRKAWKEWLMLYADDCIYWVPAWKDEYDPTDDPDTQVSLIYHARRYELEERIMRIQSRKSITAMPLPRTMHAVTNIRAVETGREEVCGDACFVVYVYDPRTLRQHMNVGRYEFALRLRDERWLFARKKITLINDSVPTVLDFYTL